MGVYMFEWVCVYMRVCISVLNKGFMQHPITHLNLIRWWYLSLHIMYVVLYSTSIIMIFSSFHFHFLFLLCRESGCTTLLLKPLRLQLVKKALSKLGIDYVEKWIYLPFTSLYLNSPFYTFLPSLFTASFHYFALLFWTFEYPITS